MPLPTQGSLLWAAWHTGDYRRAKRRWYKALLNQDHVNVDETSGVMMNVMWDDGTGRENWVPLCDIRPRGLGAEDPATRWGAPLREPRPVFPGFEVRDADSPPPKRPRQDEAPAPAAPAPAPLRRPPPRSPPPRRPPVAAPREPVAAPAPPPPRPEIQQPPVVRTAALRAAPREGIQRFYVRRQPPEVASRIGRGAYGSLLSKEVEGLPTVPSDSRQDVFYHGDDEPFVRVAPIADGSRLQACAVSVARAFIARSRLTGATGRGHDGGESKYHVAGWSRVHRKDGLGKGVTFYAPLINGLGREGSDPNKRVFHRELQMQLDAARADLSAAIEEVWPDDVGAELDLLARLRRGVEYEGLRTTTATSCTFGLHNRWHTDKMDEQDTKALSWTTVVALDLATVVRSLEPPEPRRRGRGKRQERGEGPYKHQFDQFVWDAWRTHLGERVLARPPPTAGTADGPTWKFVLGRAVTVDLGGPTGNGVVLRFQGAETWHSTFHDATYSRARCLCGLGFFNKSHIIGPLWYRLEKLMREVIVAAGLGVDDLADFDQVEDRYFEALHALPGRMDPGTHPRDALARLARGGAAPEEPAEPPERLYDDADDAVDDIAIDGLTI